MNWHEKTAMIFGALVAAESLFFWLKRRDKPTLKYLAIATTIVVVLICTGCAALPMPFQPQHMEYNSNVAEVTWIALDAVDTVQTMHIRRTNVTCSYEADPAAAWLYGSRYPNPDRVLVTNIALAVVHAGVTSWLDDKVAVHSLADDRAAPWWLTARFVWHVVSIGASAHSVASNVEHRCPL